MKKKAKQIYKRIRKTWKINPKTRVKKSKKIYKRANAKRKSFDTDEESNS